MKFSLNIKTLGLAVAMMLPVIGFSAAQKNFSESESSSVGSDETQIVVADYSPSNENEKAVSQPTGSDDTYNIKSLYDDMNLKGVIDYNLFCNAIDGLNTYSPRNKKIITLIDFSKPSDQERFYVLDLENKKLLFKTLVAHGRNSGMKFAEKFSNVEGSNMSSPGFYTTDNTYIGGNGYSLRLDGLEPGKNDNARSRAIVIHGAKYVTYEMAKSQGRIGRSLGCPALPQKQARQIIDTIKDGALLYIHV